MATWPHHIISLIITSNNILLSSSIAIIYYLILDGLLFQYTKPYLSIVEKCTSRYLICWESLPLISYCGFDIYSPTSHLLCNIVTFRIEFTWQVTWQDLILTSTFTFFQESSALPNWRLHRFKWKNVVATRTYVTRKVYSYSFIRMELRLFNLSTDCLLVKVWDLLPLGVTVGGEVEKPVRRSWPPPFVMKC